MLKLVEVSNFPPHTKKLHFMLRNPPLVVVSPLFSRNNEKKSTIEDFAAFF